MNRTIWYWYYRQLRIIRRESWKASMDSMIYGIGAVRISDDGFVNHILPEAIHAQY